MAGNNSKISIFFANWHKPREAVHILNTPLSQFLFILSIAAIYFLQCMLFFFSLEKITLAPVLTLNGMLFLFYTFIAIGIGAFTFVHACALIIWSLAKWFSPQVEIIQTRAAVALTLFFTVPLGFLFLLFAFSLKLIDPQLALTLRLIVYLGLLITTIHGSKVLITAVAEAHRINLWQALGTVILSGLILSLFGFIFFKTFLVNIRY